MSDSPTAKARESLIEARQMCGPRLDKSSEMGTLPDIQEGKDGGHTTILWAGGRSDSPMPGVPKGARPCAI